MTYSYKVVPLPPNLKAQELQELLNNNGEKGLELCQLVSDMAAPFVVFKKKMMEMNEGY